MPLLLPAVSTPVVCNWYKPTHPVPEGKSTVSKSFWDNTVFPLLLNVYAATQPAPVGKLRVLLLLAVSLYKLVTSVEVNSSLYIRTWSSMPSIAAHPLTPDSPIINLLLFEVTPE